MATGNIFGSKFKVVLYPKHNIWEFQVGVGNSGALRSGRYVNGALAGAAVAHWDPCPFRRGSIWIYGDRCHMENVGLRRQYLLIFKEKPDTHFHVK